MAADNRRGLGRGLSALLEETQAPAGEGAGPREIPIELIGRNTAQPRQSFDDAQLEELASSIREQGVLQPILLRPRPGAPGEYEIVAGERRWRAAQLAGLKAIPALVRDLDDKTTLEIALIENLQRADLNPMEEARGYQRLVADNDMTHEAVGRAVGKSRPYVANMLRLNALPQSVTRMVERGELSVGHARTIIGRDDAEEMALAFIRDHVSVRDAENLVRARDQAGDMVRKPGGRPRKAKSADTAALERDLSERLGLRVEVNDRDGAGEVRIAYRSLEQLDELVQRLMRGG
jgi:ParB family transcriptional regulator, chromosome partitioning protein